MRHKGKTISGAFIAVLAVGALVASSASAALPEFSTKAAFSGEFGSAVWKWDGIEWAYQKGYFSGTMPTKTTVGEVSLEFLNGPNGCNTTGTNMVWKGVKGRLGYISKEKKEAGLLLGEPVSTPILECGFGASKYKLSGDLIGEITPVNTKTKHFNLSIHTVGTKQEFTNFEGEAAWPLLFGTYSCKKIKLGEKEIESCTGSGKEAALEIAGMSFTTEQETEIKA